MTDRRDVGEHRALEQILRVLDNLPFVSGLKRDVATLRNVVYQRRAPRIAAIGRRRSGRTRLGNALLGKEVLPNEGEGVAGGQWIRIDADGAVLEWIEVDIDDPPIDAVDRALAEGQPDVVLLVVSPSDITDLEEMVHRAKVLLTRMADAGDGDPKVMPILGRADLIAEPAEGEEPWSADALSAIDLGRQRLDRAMDEASIEAVHAVAVAAPPDGAELHLAALAHALFDALPDRAQLEGARALSHAVVARRQVANRVVHSCSTLALTIGLAPVPLSDAFIIAPLQVVMVSAVAHLGGRPWDRKGVLEWMGSMGVVGGAGMGLRWAAQQLVKLIPGAGSLVSAGVAGAGTVTLGQSAIAYFLREEGIKQIPEKTAA